MKYLSWVGVLLKAPPERRHQWVEEIINGFKEYRSKRYSGKKFWSEVLEEGKDYELIGFAPKMEYIKVDVARGEPETDLDCIWEHQHMNPQLVYKHKTLPVIIITGPGLRFNESVLNEVGMRTDGVRGITG